MHIRPARLAELADLQRIFDIGRASMRAAGNTVQWVNGYPTDELLAHDIANGNLYVLEDAEGISHAVFAFVEGADPTYAEIDGAWLNDAPYAAIHRVASDGSVRGVMHRVVEFCARRGLDLRVDTHESNATMRGALAKEGFAECGTIVIADGTERIAYQLPART